MADPRITKVVIDWSGVPGWRKRVGAWAQVHAMVTLSRWLGASVTMEAGE